MEQWSNHGIYGITMEWSMEKKAMQNGVTMESMDNQWSLWIFHSNAMDINNGI